MNARSTTTRTPDLRATTLRMSEVYVSVQGESTHAGKPCAFVRLTGCNLRCTWCDSTFTFKGGTRRTVDDVVAEVTALGVHTVEVTGGEPLVQPAAIPLMQALVDAGHEVLLETSGSRSIAQVPAAVHVILDLKCPDSGEVGANDWSNIALLAPHHEVKFVVASRADVRWAAEVIATHRLNERCAVLLSPAWGLVEPSDLVQWMLDDAIPARLNIQLHKYLWDPNARGV